MSILKIFGFNSKLEISGNIEAHQKDFHEILVKLETILRNETYYAHADFIIELDKNLLEKNFERFFEQINTVEMWGGSGAVWEVYIKDSKTKTEFNKQMLALINLMGKTKSARRGVKPLRKFFT